MLQKTHLVTLAYFDIIFIATLHRPPLLPISHDSLLLYLYINFKLEIFLILIAALW